jgi:hypothetical protein
VPKMPAFVAQLMDVIGSVFGLRWGTEEPQFDVVESLGGVEIRQYGPRIAAQTRVRADDEPARNIGFRRLARYIFGANHRSTKIAMTAPVAQRAGERIAMTAPVAQSSRDADLSLIQFFMPSKWTRQTLPDPDDADIEIVDVPAETFAVLRFTGDRSAAEVRRRSRALVDALGGSRYVVVGAPIAWFYDPPFTLPFRRRNEVAVEVREHGEE